MIQMQHSMTTYAMPTCNFMIHTLYLITCHVIWSTPIPRYNWFIVRPMWVTSSFQAQKSSKLEATAHMRELSQEEVNKINPPC